MTDLEILKNMNLHERKIWNYNDHRLIITRVFGGWIYTFEFINSNYVASVSSVFVPEY
ncbi:MAG: hypothetical protein ACTSQG_09050 [Promethearchaeota archaeon]